MPPHEGLVHLKEYDIKDSNVELIGSDIDHRVKYNSAASEPAWNNGQVGQECGLFIWRIENFEVVPWPKERAGEFYDGDSYIVLHSYKVEDKLCHDIFFWLGSKTTQDEAGTAAYKTVELDEFLHGAATQHREVQAHPSAEFVALFPRLSIRSGGVRSGFTHVETEQLSSKKPITLLRIFKHPGAVRADSIIVHEVEPTWQSLDDHDVFVLDQGEKIWVWQGKNCSPMEKAKAAQVVNDITLAKHLDVEVLSQLESRSKTIVDLLGGKEIQQSSFQAPQPGTFPASDDRDSDASLSHKLFRLSDATGAISFDLIKDGQQISPSDLDGNDVFLCDTGSRIWVWQGSGASRREKALWLKVAQSYIRQIQEDRTNSAAHLVPISNVVQGNESPAFWKAIRV
ncbi:severin [Aspergillus udagawae]|uniref:Severin n=1 Tax=Aspergillus udagawae TaxID=91492 RepID=A0ABQ1AIG1_9EURO|nr:severin [Aspergillus udagawae]